MKISAGWKIVLYAFVVVLLVQGYDLAYYLMNRKDSFLANLGLVTLFTMFAGTLYSLYQLSAVFLYILLLNLEYYLTGMIYLAPSLNCIYLINGIHYHYFF